MAAEVICVVYTGDMDVTPSELLLHVRLQLRVEFIYRELWSAFSHVRRRSALEWTLTAKARLQSINQADPRCRSV